MDHKEEYEKETSKTYIIIVIALILWIVDLCKS